MPISKPIFLVGPMGSGKTYVGKKLAQLCGLPFYDLDHLIEEGEKESISHLFESIGEKQFRILEAQYLRKVTTVGIIATGGGTPCFHENMDWMNSHGFTIYLDTSVDILTSRLQHQRSHRPLIAEMTKNQLTPYLRQMLQERRVWYEKAQYIYCQTSEKLPVEQDIHSSFLNFLN